MVWLVGLILVSLTVSYFYTNLLVLAFSQVAVALLTIAGYGYDCMVIVQLGVGACQTMNNVLNTSAQNTGVLTVIFLLAMTAGKPIKGFFRRS